MIIDGKKIAGKIISDLSGLPKPDKMLAAVLVGSAGSPQAAQSKSFLKQKEKMAEALGIPFHLYQFDESVTENRLIDEIKAIGADDEIGGIIVQLPLPPHYGRDAVLSAINPKKDIDAMTPEGKKMVDTLPVAVVKDILSTLNLELLTLTVAVVGRGFLVGKPIMEWLDSIKKPYKLFHSKSDISEIRDYDLIITGVGKGGLIKPEMLKPGAGVIDFGYSFATRMDADSNADKRGKILGDFDASSAPTVVGEPARVGFKDQMSNISFYTPTPGGTGPILVAEIFKNFYKLNS